VFPLLRPVKGDTVYLIEVPVEGGGRLLVEASKAELPGDLQLAAARPGEVVARARQSLEQALDQIKRAMRAVLDRLVAMSPDEASVEFGLTLGAETGVVVAKGTSEMHFAVTLSWKRPESAASGD
jgi:surfactin synthase thioesterase subunit